MITACDVAIVGGGIIGVTAALELAERGLSVAVFEKGTIGCEQSSRNWGWVRKMGRDIRELPLMIASARLWAGMNARVEGETGFVQSGILYLARHEADLAKRATWLKQAGDLPHGSKLIGPEEVKALLPQFTGPCAGALYTADDGRAEPSLATQAIADGARKKGAKIITHCAVRGYETEGGHISAIVTEKGPVRCQTLIVAGGAWTRRFLGRHGIGFPQLSVVNSVLRTKPFDGPTLSASCDEFAFRKRRDGGYTIGHNLISVADLTPDHFRLMLPFLPALKEDWSSLKIRIGQRFFDEAKLARHWALDHVSPFEQVRVLNPAPVDFVLDLAMRNLTHYLPDFSQLVEAERWAGIIDTMPDVVPVIDHVARVPGLVIASGFSGHGFGIGPGAGHLVADLVTGAPPIVDPTPFKLQRFGAYAG